MKIPEIKKIVENYSLAQIKKAEIAISQELKPEIEIAGKDEGERLTHAFAAVQIKEAMDEKNMDFKSALRAYTSRVRNSIS